MSMIPKGQARNVRDQAKKGCRVDARVSQGNLADDST